MITDTATKAEPLAYIEGKVACLVRQLAAAVLELHPDANIVGKVQLPLADKPVAMLEIERADSVTLVRMTF